MEYIFDYTMGDDTDSGHHMKESGTIRCNHSNEEMLAALGQFNKESGLDWKSWCSEYEDDRIHEEDLDRLLEMGIIDQELHDKLLDEDDGELTSDLLIRFIMDVVKHYLPDLDWAFVYPERRESAFFTGCGYGCQEFH